MEEKAALRIKLTSSVIASEVAASKLTDDARKAKSSTGGSVGEPSDIPDSDRGVHAEPRSGEKIDMSSRFFGQRQRTLPLRFGRTKLARGESPHPAYRWN
jgi:hypothetical protein